jgi:hypothetical protein
MHLLGKCSVKGNHIKFVPLSNALNDLLVYCKNEALKWKKVLSFIVLKKYPLSLQYR